MKKKTFYSELAYFIALIGIGFGVALAARAGFGVSMIAAPAYTLHLKFLEFTDAVSLGTIEYIIQILLIIILGIVLKKFKFSYLFSFVTAVFSGLAIDLAVWCCSFIPEGGILLRAVLFCASLLSCAFGVSCFFHTYIAQAAHELFVKELAEGKGKDIHKVKIAYDIAACVLSIVLNLIFFAGFKGVGIGTVVTAAVNGILIANITKILDKHFEFKDAFPKLKKVFEK